MNYCFHVFLLCSLISCSEIRRICSKLDWFWGRRFAWKSDMILTAKSRDNTVSSRVKSSVAVRLEAKTTTSPKSYTLLTLVNAKFQKDLVQSQIINPLLKCSCSLTDEINLHFVVPLEREDSPLIDNIPNNNIIQMLVTFQRNKHVCSGFFFIKTHCIPYYILLKNNLKW